MLNLLYGAVAGSTLLYFFDPDNGRRRRNMARDRATAILRGGGRELARRGRFAGAETYGLSKKLTHLKPEDPFPPNDAALAHKVESEVFADPDIPKGGINFNVEGGVVVLRGEVERQEQIDKIEAAVKRVPRVRDVENLLHLPSEPARMS